ARFILDQYLENQLTPVQRERLEEHLSTCASCTREVAHQRGYRRLLERYFDALKAPEGFAEGLALELDKPGTAIRKRPPTEVGPVLVEPPRRGSRAVPIAGAVVIAAVAIGLVAYLWPHSRAAAAASIATVSGSASMKAPDASDWKPVAA